MTRLSIVIVSYNTCSLLLRCLQSIQQYPPTCPYGIIVVDNASSDDTVKMVRTEFPHVAIVENTMNIGFARANNQGIALASGDLILLLNSDAQVTENALTRLIGFLDEHSDAVATAPMLLNDDGSFQRSYFEFPSAAKVLVHILGARRLAMKVLSTRLGKPFTARNVAFSECQTSANSLARPVPYVLFACVLLRRAVFTQVGLLDENMFFYHEDCEFGYRLKKIGKPIWWVPESRVIHLGGGSSRLETVGSFQSYFASLIYLFDKHQSMVSRIALRSAVLLGFAFRAAVATLGGFREVAIPSTYNSNTGTSYPGSRYRRARLYFSLATMAFQRTHRRAYE